MTLEFKNTEKQITEDEIRTIAETLEVDLPEDFINHFVRWNGGYPTLSLVVIDPEYHCENIPEIEIKDFIPFRYSKDFGDDPDFTLEGRVAEEWKTGEVPRNFLPFGMDWLGNYLCIDVQDHRIAYYDRDTADTCYIAPSFTRFISNLRFCPTDFRLD